jgi:hypothetical protein
MNAYPLLPYYSVSQDKCVSIELSIHCEKDTVLFFPVNDIVCRPYLNIIYRNNSDRDIYFLKVSGKNNGMANVSMAIPINPRPSIEQLAFNHTDFTDNNFIVLLDRYEYGLQPWTVYDIKDNESFDLDKEAEMSMVNFDISNINKNDYPLFRPECLSLQSPSI